MCAYTDLEYSSTGTSFLFYRADRLTLETRISDVGLRWNCCGVEDSRARVVADLVRLDSGQESLPVVKEKVGIVVEWKTRAPE